MPTNDPVVAVTNVLEGYAEKALLRGINPGVLKNGVLPFTMLWHFDRRFDLRLSLRTKTLTFVDLLPSVPRNSSMDREFKAWIKSLHSTKLPEHRRVLLRKATLTTVNRGGAVSLIMTVRGSDWDYATRKLIHVVHELFLGFLRDGPYFEYLVEVFGLDPDRY